MIAHRLKSLNSKQLALLAAGLILVFLLLIGLAGGMGGEADKHPKLGLMTSLPLYWGESDIGEIVRQDGEPMASYKRLAARYDISLIDAIDAKSLKSMHMLLLAQSRALSAEEFVELDAWVRRGGHLMILADPALQWESRYPLGDKRRPLFTSLLSPLFKHWGLELILPIGDDSGGETLREIGDHSIRTVTPGMWQMTKDGGEARCVTSDKALLAACAVGKGNALLLADADMLAEEYWVGSGIRAISGSDDFDNMNWLVANLVRLWVLRMGRG